MVISVFRQKPLDGIRLSRRDSTRAFPPACDLVCWIGNVILLSVRDVSDMLCEFVQA